jgi:4-amino-4-deoxy-L-arabinose transferase-like glycosyltransferase
LRKVLTPRSFLAVLLLLIPSAVYLWHFDDLPQFGDLQDDGLYYVSAKSLADGGGYRIESLPGEPAQTKYPPLYPLLLSVAWRIDPQFPRNLPVAAWISWLALPAMLVLSAAYFPKLGVSGWRAWLLLCLMAINPYVILYSSKLMSELPFLALILLTMLLVESAQAAGRSVKRRRNSGEVAAPGESVVRDFLQNRVDGEGGTALAIAAGAVAGLAYLTRSAGIVMVPAAIAYFALRGTWRRGLWFAAAMVPFIAGWMLWAQFYQAHSADSALRYYTDYLGHDIDTLRRVSLHMLLWKNIDSLMWGVGALFVPEGVDSQVLKILAQALGVAAISGVVRMVRRGHGVLYALFGAGSMLILAVWDYPEKRLVFPLLPLAMAGLLVEMEHLAGMVRAGLRHRDRSQRILARALAAAATVVLVGSLALEIVTAFVGLPGASRAQRLENANRIAAYRWIAANVPAEANLLTIKGDDPLLFLYAGRHAISNALPPLLWYQDENSRMVEWIGNPVPFARAHGLKYFEFAGVDVQGLRYGDRAAAERAIRENPDFTALYRNGPVTVYALPQ